MIYSLHLKTIKTTLKYFAKSFFFSNCTNKRKLYSHSKVTIIYYYKPAKQLICVDNVTNQTGILMQLGQKKIYVCLLSHVKKI
jgi:hypothetical protein